MTEENKPSEKHILFIYFCYVSVLLLIITSILNLWTALASLGAFFLFLICPFITGIIAFKNYKKIKISKTHKKLFYFSSFYTIGVIITIIFVRIF
jgi:heme O synthase-like polyprenyltransferase